MRTLRDGGEKKSRRRDLGDGAQKLGTGCFFLFPSGPRLNGLYIVENAIAKDHWQRAHSFGLVCNIHWPCSKLCHSRVCNLRGLPILVLYSYSVLWGHLAIVESFPILSRITWKGNKRVTGQTFLMNCA